MKSGLERGGTDLMLVISFGGAVDHEARKARLVPLSEHISLVSVVRVLLRIKRRGPRRGINNAGGKRVESKSVFRRGLSATEPAGPQRTDDGHRPGPRGRLLTSLCSISPSCCRHPSLPAWTACTPPSPLSLAHLPTMADLDKKASKGEPAFTGRLQPVRSNASAQQPADGHLERNFSGLSCIGLAFALLNSWTGAASACWRLVSQRFELGGQHAGDQALVAPSSEDDLSSLTDLVLPFAPEPWTRSHERFVCP